MHQQASIQEKKKLLVLGAASIVGFNIIKSLSHREHSLEVTAGINDFEKDRQRLAKFKIRDVAFNFSDTTTYRVALAGCNILFLLYPPELSEVEKYFKPLIGIAVVSGIMHIVFLSVQGVEYRNKTPHHKIEKLIVDSHIPYTFLRPAYFMQNFTTTLHTDLVNKNRIFLPAGDTRFNFVDVLDIASVAAEVLIDTDSHVNRLYELTSNEKLTFTQIAKKLSSGLDTHIEYISPNLLMFCIVKKRERVPIMLILVTILLHYFPRFLKEPAISDCIKRITGKEPTTFDQYVNINKPLLA